MHYKRFSIECNKDYFANIYRSPDLNPLDLLDFPLHWHRDYEIVYVHSGALTLQKLDTSITLNAGDSYFINSEEVHSYNSDNRSELQVIFLNFPVRAITPYFADPCKVDCFCIDSPETKAKISKSISRLMTCKNFNDRLETLKIKSVLNDISYYLFRDCKVENLKYFRGGSDSDDFYCAKNAISYMETNYKTPITLDEISSHVGMTSAHFSKYFKDKIGLTFSKYLRKVRLEHAVNDMRTSDFSVKEAALQNGFPNVNSFIMGCKSEYGRTPSELKIPKTEEE